MKKNNTLAQMKLMPNSVLSCLVLTSLILTSVITSMALAANSTEKPVRWFEMEVILFSQLGDKTQLNENFVGDNVLPKYKGVRELLSNYLKPDITQLKKTLPVCSTPAFQTLNKTTQYVTTPYVINSLLVKKWNNTLTTEYQAEPLVTLKSLNMLRTEILNESSGLSSTSPLDTVDKKENRINDPINRSIIDKNFINDDFVYTYSPITFSVQPCQLSQQTITALKQSDPTFNDNSLTVNSVPKTIDGIEQLYSDQPYLISKSSLQLNDIVNKLRWSKEFQPMLHIGWRQSEPAINTKKSIPMHIFAGENLQAAYQQQLKQFNEEQAKASQQEEQLHNILSGSSGYTDGKKVTELDNSSDDIINTIEFKRQLKDVIASLSNIPENDIDLIAKLDQLKRTQEKNLQITLDEQSVNKKASAPIAPSQDWSIDGLFNVHVDHYLYITADFNIANMTLAEQASASLAKGEPQIIESVRFSQNKRVISKEIHYFDHPYMGMIVQIRRYKRPIPEAVTLN